MWVRGSLKHTVEPHPSIRFPVLKTCCRIRDFSGAFPVRARSRQGKGFPLAQYNDGAKAMKKIVAKKRHSIRKSQAQDLLTRLAEQIGPSAKLFHADMIEVLETNADISLFLVNKKPLLMDTGTWVFPTLRGAVQIPFSERRVAVDAGAIPYVINGADIMRPGIVSVTDDVKANAPVQVVDERHGKPLAVGIALFDAPAMRAATGGKMVKKFQYVGDEIWNLEI